MQNRRTILVVDDVAMFRELESVFLARCGRVVTAATGAEALKIVRRDPQPSIVVLDMTLPDADGESICREIKTDPATTGIPIIAVTSSGAGHDYARAVEAGADDVISKPLSRTGLIEAVTRFIRFDPPRGLPRVVLDVPGMIHIPGGEVEATILNLSRGGLFVESDLTPPNHGDVRIEFDLPETDIHVRARVQIMWARPGAAEHESGLGLRFLDLDRGLTTLLDDYVHERTKTLSPVMDAPLLQGSGAA